MNNDTNNRLQDYYLTNLLTDHLLLAHFSLYPRICPGPDARYTTGYWPVCFETCPRPLIPCRDLSRHGLDWIGGTVTLPGQCPWCVSSNPPSYEQHLWFSDNKFQAYGDLHRRNVNINTQLLHILALTRSERVTSDIDRQNVMNTIQDMSPLQHDPAPGAKVI